MKILDGTAVIWQQRFAEWNWLDDVLVESLGKKLVRFTPFSCCMIDVAVAKS